MATTSPSLPASAPPQEEEEDDTSYADILETRASSMSSTRHDTAASYLKHEHGQFTKASVDTPLQDDSRGMKLLAKMGWKKGTGLGKEGTGMVAPLQLVDASLGYGLGKAEEYEQAHGEATRSRKLLDVEVEETAELKQQRADKAEREAVLRQEIKEMNKEFYCEVCDKQYKTVVEMESHLSSYDHHHTKRLKEMKEANRQRQRAATKPANPTKQDDGRLSKEMQRRIAAATAASAPAAAQTTSEERAPVKLSMSFTAKNKKKLR